MSLSEESGPFLTHQSGKLGVSSEKIDRFSESIRILGWDMKPPTGLFDINFSSHRSRSGDDHRPSHGHDFNKFCETDCKVLCWIAFDDD